MQDLNRSLEQRAKAHPERADYLRDLSVSCERMGDLLRGLGQGEQARQYYQKALENWERLIRHEPDRAEYLRGVCIPYDRIGDLLRDLGQGEQARQYYQKELENWERLIRQEPERADNIRGPLTSPTNKHGRSVAGAGAEGAGPAVLPEVC